MADQHAKKNCGRPFDDVPPVEAYADAFDREEDTQHNAGIRMSFDDTGHVHKDGKTNGQHNGKRKTANGTGKRSAKRSDEPQWAGPPSGKTLRLENTQALLTHLGFKLRYCEFSDQVQIIRGRQRKWRLLQDQHLDIIIVQAQRFGLFMPEKDLVRNVKYIARRNAIHPVKDYLDGLTWDGTPRIETWLTDYAGVENTELNREFGKRFLLGAVKRIIAPGHKIDHALILEGRQGINKSSLLKVLAGDDYFSDSLTVRAGDKEVIEQTSGKWICELAELSGLNKSDREHVKAFLSRDTDRARLAYGRETVERPRQFVIAGTVNDKKYLTDNENRRFWPISIPNFIDLEPIKRDRDQLWAEAVHLINEEASTDLPRHLWEAAAAEQANRVVEHPWFERLEECFGDRDGRVSVKAVQSYIGIKLEHNDPWKAKRLTDAMEKLGFEKRKVRMGTSRAYYYVRGETSGPDLESCLGGAGA